MGRREEQKAHTRRALLDTSLGLFREIGFDETRVQDIVERVGVSPATFFNYFPSKEAVLDAASYESTKTFIELLQAEVAELDRPAGDRLLEIAALSAVFMSEDPKISALLATRTGLLSGATGELAKADREAQELLALLFAQGMDAGEFSPSHDPLQLAELYTAALTQTTINHLTGWFDTQEPLPHRTRRAIAIILAGASSPPPTDF